MRRAIVWLLGAAAAGMALPGCRLHFTEFQQNEQDLEHYKAAATQLEYPDSQTPLRPELAVEPSPLAIGRDAPPEYWDLSLTEVLRLALTHSKVLSDVGGAVLQSPTNLRTIQGPAITETDPRFGVDATLSAFDPVLSTSTNFTGNHQAINNVFFGGGTRILEENTAVMQTSITKRTAFGGTLGVTENMDYDASNAPGNLYPHAYNTNWEVSAKQSWLQGGGALFNRVYGPPNVPGVFSGVPGFANGVMVARINTDISLTEFEIGVRDLVSNVENAYWDLYFAYRDLDAKIAARDSALKPGGGSMLCFSPAAAVARLRKRPRPVSNTSAFTRKCKPPGMGGWWMALETRTAAVPAPSAAWEACASPSGGCGCWPGCRSTTAN